MKRRRSLGRVEHQERSRFAVVESREDKTVVAVVVVVVSCSCRRWSEAGVVGVDVKVEGGPRRSQKSPQRRQQRPSSRDSEGRQPKNSATESSRQQAASSGQDADEADEADEGEGRETSQRSKKSESERDGTTRKNKTDVEVSLSVEPEMDYPPASYYLFNTKLTPN